MMGMGRGGNPMMIPVQGVPQMGMQGIPNGMNPNMQGKIKDMMTVPICWDDMINIILYSKSTAAVDEKRFR